eukprot:Tbor_TRINITY_DN8251_c0_g1::TRINITY_DN8251_c0_g1_i1::g.15446::m.15446/K00940/ndk, NME; nucleoside-diphosphate kinase
MARCANDPRLTFKAVQTDVQSYLTKEYQLRFFFLDRTIELYDLKLKKLSLKRSDLPPSQMLERKDFVLGKEVVVFGRMLKLIEYMDIVTKELCEGGGVSYRPLLGPDAMQADLFRSPQESTHKLDRAYLIVEHDVHFRELGKILSVLEVELGFTLTGAAIGTLPKKQVEYIVKDSLMPVLPNNGDGSSTMVIRSKDLSSSLSHGHMVTMDATGDLSALTSSTFANKMVCIFRGAKPNSDRHVPELVRRLSQTTGRTGSNPRDTSGLWACATNSFPILFGSEDSREYSKISTRTGGIGTISKLTKAADIHAAKHPMEAIFDLVTARSAVRYKLGSSECGTVVILKPHLVGKQLAGDVLQVMLDSLNGGKYVSTGSGMPSRSEITIGGMRLVNLSSSQAGNFLSPYRGLLPNYSAVVEELASGAAIAVHFTTLEMIEKDVDECSYSADDCMSGNENNSDRPPKPHPSRAVSSHDIFHQVREICGPFDPLLAKTLRSSCIRARFGIAGYGAARNGIHCCDLEEETRGAGMFLFSQI